MDDIKFEPGSILSILPEKKPTSRGVLRFPKRSDYVNFSGMFTQAFFRNDSVIFLIFLRCLNLMRNDQMSFDICDSDRGNIVDFLAKNYGSDNVEEIILFLRRMSNNAAQVKENDIKITFLADTTKMTTYYAPWTEEFRRRIIL